MAGDYTLGVHEVRRIGATFLSARAARSQDVRGVVLAFAPGASRLDVDRIESFSATGPELTIPAVVGLGRVLRVLRAARVAAPREPRVLAGDEPRILSLLERARGAKVLLDVRRRSRLRFTAWTESGVETVDDVVDVAEAPDAWLVVPRGERLPVRFPRATVVRRSTRRERWYEILDIERA
jgi:hypothetical protein